MKDAYHRSVMCPLLAVALCACGLDFASAGGAPPGAGGAAGSASADGGASLGGGGGGGALGGGGAASTGPFGTPVPLITLNSDAGDDDPTLTADMLEIYFASSRSPTLGGADIWYAKRVSVNDPWPLPEHVPELSSDSDETGPEISPDGLTMWVSRDFPREIYRATRPDRGAAWSTPELEPALNSGSDDYHGNVSSDGLSIFISSNRNGVVDLYVATRSASGEPWSTPLRLSELATPEEKSEPMPDWDSTTLYYRWSSPGDGLELWRSTRASPTLPWQPPEPVAELNTPQNEGDPWISPDGHTMYFASDRDGGSDLYIAER